MKKALSVLLLAAMICALFAFPTSAAWDGTSVSASLKGDGTADSPYLVETAEDLTFLARSVNEGNTYEGKYIVQTADIDLGGKEERAGGIIGSVYSAKAEYIFDQCISVGELKGSCFSLANRDTALATSTANADAATIALAKATVEGLMKTSERTIAGFDTSKGAPEPEVTEPEVTEPVTPPTTGDASMIFVIIAGISLAGVAIISKRREN